ncbi:MAG: hypothetical protein WC196_07105 [Bacilli bacterium]|jgi:hypothetical protein
MHEKRTINQYVCSRCGKSITTVDIDPGTTPVMLVCRATPGCGGSMFSQMYLVDQTLEPEYEWFMPDYLPEDRDLRDHVRRGGLLLRQKGVADG